MTKFEHGGGGGSAQAGKGPGVSVRAQVGRIETNGTNIKVGRSLEWVEGEVWVPTFGCPRRGLAAVCSSGTQK